MNNSLAVAVTRRVLLKGGLAAGAGLVLSGALPRLAGASSAVGYDHFTVRALTILNGFAGWCQANGVQGAITESGIPECDGAEYMTACCDWQQFNAAWDVWYKLADKANLPVMPWIASRGFGNDALAIFSDDGESWYINTVRSSANVVCAHCGPFRGVNLSGAEFPGPNDGISKMAQSGGFYSSGNPGKPDRFDKNGNYYDGDYLYPMGPNAYPGQPAPVQNDWAFLYGQGVRLIRFQLPGWERMQPTLGGSLNATVMNQLAASLADAAAANTGGDLKVILDLHQYCRYTRIPSGGTKTTKPTVANGGVSVMRTVSNATRVIPDTRKAPNAPGVLTAANLADFWSKVVAWTKTLPASSRAVIYALSLMNEPHDLYAETAPVKMSDAQVWEYCSKQAVAAIRSAGWSGTIYVPGYNWQSAEDWADTHPKPWIPAGQGPVVYDAHHYLDTYGTGVDYQVYSQEDADAAAAGYGTTWTW